MSKGHQSTNPYPGLRAFRQEEDYLFFGREEQSIELLQRLGGNRFLAVVGTSGSGKSSLVRCGLLSELLGGKMRQAGASWEVAVTHPGGNPLALLTEALLEADLYDIEEESVRENLLATLSRSHFGLVEAVRQAGLGEGTNFLLVVDQFEELFRFREAGSSQREAAAEFVSLLLETVAQSEVPIYVVLTMRSDFIGECSQFDGLAEMVNTGEFLIPKLTREQYKRVIEGPARVAGGQIAPRLLQRLLNDLGQQADQLPCLQHALMRTWDFWAEAGETEALDLDDYRRVGRMAEALSQHADEVYESLDSDRQREWCRGIFEALTVKESENRGIRRPQRLASLSEILEVPVERLIPVIDAYRRQGVTFLMPSPEVGLNGETIIDISHESLMRVWVRLRHWVEEEAQAAGIYRRLAESATLYDAGKAGLYRDPELGIARAWLHEARHANQAWAERYRPGFAEAMAFLDASKSAAEAEEREKEVARQRELEQARALGEAQQLRVKEQERAGRRLKILLGIAAVIAILAGIASIFAVRQGERARESELASQKSELAAQDLAGQLKVQLVRGDFAAANQRLKTGDEAASLAYLARAMRTDPGFAAAGMRTLSTLGSGKLPVRRFAPLEHEEPISYFARNEKHDLLLTGSDDTRDVRVWDMNTGKLLFRPSVRDAGIPIPMTPLREGNAGDAAIPDDFREKLFSHLYSARKIWLASDPDEPPAVPRYFSFSIPLPQGKTIERADVFIAADDSFKLTIDGKEIGGGDEHQKIFHAEVTESVTGSSAEVLIEAANSGKTAALVAAFGFLFTDGSEQFFGTDKNWMSSNSQDGEKKPSREFPGDHYMARAPWIADFHWSVDRDRLIANVGTAKRIMAWDAKTGQAVGQKIDSSKLIGPQHLEVSNFDELGDIIAFPSKETGSLQVWNLTTGQAMTEPLKTAGNVIQWQFTPGGRKIVGLFSDAVIAVWDALDGSLIEKVTTRPLRASAITMSGDGKFIIATDDTRKRLKFWKIGGKSDPDSAPWVELPFAFEEMRVLKGDPALTVIRGGGPESLNKPFRARTFDLESREQLADITTPQPIHRRMGLLANDFEESFGIHGTVAGNMINIWDLRTGKEIQRLLAPELLDTATLSPDGFKLVAGSLTRGSAAGTVTDKKLFIFDLLAGGLVFPHPIVLAGTPMIQISPDGGTLITIDTTADTVRFWDLSTGRQRHAPVSVPSPRSIFLSRSGNRAAIWQYMSTSLGTQSIGQTTGRISLHQVGIPAAIPGSLTDPGSGSASVHAPAGGRSRWFTLDRPDLAGPSRLRSWDAKNHSLQYSRDLEIKSDRRNYEVTWSKDGGRLLCSVEENRVSLIDTSSGNPLQSFVISSGTASRLALSADGQVVVIGDTEGGLKTWSAKHGETDFKPFSDNEAIRQSYLNEDGSLMVIGDLTKRRIAIVKTESGAPVFGPYEAVNTLQHAVFTPDGKTAVVSIFDTKILLVDLAEGKVVRELEIDDAARGIDLAPGGRTLAVGSGGNLSATTGKAYLLNLDSGKRLVPPLEANGTVLDVKFSPDGRMLATATYPNAGFAYVQLWDVATGAPLTDPVGLRAYVNSMSFQGDGSKLGISLNNGATKILTIPPLEEVPSWMPDLTEAIAGTRIDPDTGTLEDLDAAALDVFREKLTTSSSTGAWTLWAKWLFAEQQTRAISPGSRKTMQEHLAGLRSRDDLLDLDAALHLVPDDALTYARVAMLQAALPRQSLNPSLQAHARECAVYFSDRAIKLAPESPEVWAMRAELMRGMQREEQAASAAERALALSPAGDGSDSKDPNIHYQSALTHAARNEWEKANEAFARALDLLDDYYERSTAGEKLLPLLGSLQRLAPAQVTDSGGPPSEGTLAGSESISKEPIPGAFEDFNKVVPGQLPPGWRVWNESQSADGAGIHHASHFGTDSWKDWTVIDRKQLDYGNNPLRKGILRKGAGKNPVVDGVEVPLLEGRFALAVSQNRAGGQIHYLESPDFDCSSREDVHLAFHSSYEQGVRSMGMLEYSVDGGEKWKPVVYFVHKPFLDEAKKKYAAANGGGRPDAAGFDVAEFLGEERLLFPRRLDKESLARPAHYGAFTVAADTPGLGERIVGRGGSLTNFKRREVFALPDAGGAATVRLRFGLASLSRKFWGIDKVGLYESSKAAGKKEAVAALDPSKPDRELEKPANDSKRLTELAMEMITGRKPAEATAPDPTPFMATAMATIGSVGGNAKPGAGTGSSAQAPNTGKILEARLLVGRARKLDPENREARVAAAMMELGAMAAFAGDEESAKREAPAIFGKAQEILHESTDLAADLGDPMWSQVYSLITVFRGAIAAEIAGDRKQAIPLVVFAQTIDAGGPAEAIGRQILASLQSGEDGAPAASSNILLPRGSGWSYFDEGKLPDPDWMQPEFEDRQWFRGPAGLGYGNDGEKTVVGFGPDKDHKYTTTYFRTRFDVKDPSSIGSLLLHLKRDDGAAVYLNGQEIVRDNLPEGEILYKTLAPVVVSNANEKRFHEHVVEEPPLRKGENVLAVEVHQKNLSSSDLGFDLEVVARSGSDPSGGVGRDIAASTFVEQFKSFAVPDLIQAKFWNLRAEHLARDGDLAGASVALGQAAAAGVKDEGDPRQLRIRALIAAEGGNISEANRFYTAAMDGILQQSSEGVSLDVGALPIALRQAALLLKREPSDLAFVFRRVSWGNLFPVEIDLVLHWAREKAGDDPGGLAQIWHGLSDHLDRHEDALKIAESVLTKLPKPRPGASAEELGVYGAWLSRKVRVLRELGDEAGANKSLADLIGAIPRDPSLEPKQLDLSKYFNSSIYHSWSDSWGSTLSRLPGSFVPLKGVGFDLRGSIQLESGVVNDGKTMNEIYDREFPLEVKGIEVDQATSAIHFLTSCQWGRDDKGTEVGRFVMHFEDGTSKTMPLNFGLDVGDWYVANSIPVDQAQIGWRGTNDRGAYVNLSELVWKNPHPDKTIKTIDFISAKAKAGPFLLGITLE